MALAGCTGGWDDGVTWEEWIAGFEEAIGTTLKDISRREIHGDLPMASSPASGFLPQTVCVDSRTSPTGERKIQLYEEFYTLKSLTCPPM